MVSFLFAFPASLLVCHSLGLKAYAAPAWIPIFIVCFWGCAFLTAPSLAKLVLANGPSGRPKGAIERNLLIFLSFWFGSVVFILCYAFVLGWIAFLSGGTPRDIREFMDVWSVPLGWVNPAFVIRPSTGLVAAIGIVSANCYFFSLGLMMVFQVVHQLLRRNRVTELGISSHTLRDDDDES